MRVPAAAAPPQPRWLRVVDALAGLLSAGMLVIGVTLLLVAVVAPMVSSGDPLGTATGPGWPRVVAHLLVGAFGEVVVRYRGRWPLGGRVAADLAAIVLALLVAVWAWWP